MKRFTVDEITQPMGAPMKKSPAGKKAVKFDSPPKKSAAKPVITPVQTSSPKKSAAKQV